MTPEEIEADRKRRQALRGSEAHGGAGLPPPPSQAERDAQLEVESHGGQASTALPPPPPVTPKPPGGGAGTTYGPGLDARTSPGPLPPPPPVTPYTSDSSAETIRSKVDPSRTGGGFAGTPQEPTIYPPPPPITGPAAGELPTAPARTTVPPPVVANRTTTTGVSGQSEWTDAQREAAAAIRNTLSGKTPSVAELQQKAAENRATAAVLSGAAGVRGRSVASVNRQAANQIAQIRMDAAAQGAQLRAQETAQARGELASLGTAARGQDLQAETSNAELTLKAALASDDREYGASVENARNALAAVGLDDKYTNDWLGNWLTLRQQNQTEKLAVMERDLRVWLANHPQAKDFWDKLGAVGGFLGGLGQAGAGAAKAGLTGGAGAAV